MEEVKIGPPPAAVVQPRSIPPPPPAPRFVSPGCRGGGGGGENFPNFLFPFRSAKGGEICFKVQLVATGRDLILNIRRYFFLLCALQSAEVNEIRAN